MSNCVCTLISICMAKACAAIAIGKDLQQQGSCSSCRCHTQNTSSCTAAGRLGSRLGCWRLSSGVGGWAGHILTTICARGGRCTLQSLLQQPGDGIVDWLQVGGQHQAVQSLVLPLCQGCTCQSDEGQRQKSSSELHFDWFDGCTRRSGRRDDVCLGSATAKCRKGLQVDD